MKLTNPDLQQGNHQGKKDWYNDWFRNVRNVLGNGL